MQKHTLGATAIVALFAATSSVIVPSAAFAQAIPTFSGADGAGAGATGGRGGDVYHVTLVDQSYADTRPGTLRAALSNVPAGGRTIVFDVGGTFRLDRAPTSGYAFDGNGWDTQSRLNIPSNVTIAGQTAPSAVTIMGGVLKASGTNSVIRNVTIAPGYGRRNFANPGVAPTPGDWPDSYVYDAIDISGSNLMIDHVTAVYSTDETISANELANNLTVQYSNISQGQNYPQADAEASGLRYTGHGLGSLLQAGSNAQISFHHNLYANQKGRLPRVGTEASKLTVAGVGAFNDFRNNVFSNWFDTAGTGASGQSSQNNFIGNFYLAGNGGDDVSQSAGPDGISGNADDVATIVNKNGGTGIFNGNDSTRTKVYHSGNVKDTNRDGDALDGVALSNSDFGSSAFQAAAFATPYLGATDTAAVAYDQVLDHVGANWWNRSALDARIVNEVRTGTGRIKAWADDPFNNDPNEGTEWRAMANAPTVARAAGFDTDGDGMPDAWEAKHGLNPNVADNNGDFDADGYTNLEEYINELAEWPASRTVTFNGATNNRYAQITNWDIRWQPNKYDSARIASGTVVVDAVGQHAGRLDVRGTGGSVATLSVTAGWLDVAGELSVGAAASLPAGGLGTVAQAGGTVLAGDRVFLGIGGRYELSGGELITPLLARETIGGGAFVFTGGTLHAARVAFDLAIAGTGTLAPGLGVGTTTIDGNLTMTGGALEMQLASGSLFDALSVAGLATIDGELRILASYAPLPGQQWTILTAAGGITGAFDTITPGYAVTIVGNSLVLSVPEPTTLAALAGVAGVALRRRRQAGPRDPR